MKKHFEKVTRTVKPKESLCWFMVFQGPCGQHISIFHVLLRSGLIKVRCL